MIDGALPEDVVVPPHLAPEASRIQRLARLNRDEDEHLRRLLSFVLAADHNAIDIGAHGGSVLRELCRVAPRGRHVAVEPIPRLARLLRRLYPQVDVLELALSDRSGEADFVHVTTLPSWSGLRRRPYPPRVRDGDLEVLRVRTERLDDVVPVGYVPHLVKIDVEGGELDVLRGARRLLKTHRPIVVFELSQAPADIYGADGAGLHALLTEEIGLRIYDLDGDGPYGADELVHAATHDLHRNYVART